MTAPEFSRPIRLDTLGVEPRTIQIEAGEAESAALATRFGLDSIERLGAKLTLVRKDSEVIANGMLKAAVTQACVATAAPIAVAVETPFELVFRPAPEAGSPDEEVELSSSELDVIFYDGASIDVGEAVAETLFLSVDPYPRAPAAGAALNEAGVKSEEEAGPFGALAALRDKLGK